MNKLRHLAEKIVSVLRKAGHDALFAGGCVRDMVMNAEPDDYDIATSAVPDEVVKLFKRTLEVGARFGVVVILLDDHQFEVATFRTESSYSDGRHPDTVEFSTPEGDVKRRDFTINGLLYDPVRKKIIDYVGGEKDIGNRIVRTIGDPVERFGEDRLRMLRAVRFAARLGFRIDPPTFDVIKEMAPRISEVSVERISAELIKMMTGENADTALELMHETGLLKEILPEVDTMVGVEQAKQYHPEGDVFQHTKLLLAMLQQPSDVLAMAALLHDVGKPPTFTITDRIRFHNHDVVGARMADGILRRLKFSNDKRKKVASIIKNHMRFMHAKEMRQSTLKKFIGGDTFEEELELHRLDCLASHGGLDIYDFLVEKRNELPEEEIKPRPLINGNDLIEMGMTPGPVFQEILSKVEEMQLEGELATREDALKWVSGRS